MVSSTGLVESSGIGLLVAVSRLDSGSSEGTVAASESVESETEVESTTGSDGGISVQARHVMYYSSQVRNVLSKDYIFSLNNLASFVVH